MQSQGEREGLDHSFPFLPGEVLAAGDGQQVASLYSHHYLAWQTHEDDDLWLNGCSYLMSAEAGREQRAVA